MSYTLSLSLSLSLFITHTHTYNIDSILFLSHPMSSPRVPSSPLPHLHRSNLFPSFTPLIPVISAFSITHTHPTIHVTASLTLSNFLSLPPSAGYLDIELPFTIKLPNATQVSYGRMDDDRLGIYSVIISTLNRYVAEVWSYLYVRETMLGNGNCDSLLLFIEIGFD